MGEKLGHINAILPDKFYEAFIGISQALRKREGIKKEYFVWEREVRKGTPR